jgi:predicted TIM-barrel fold metal-dependent hydrolase
MMFSGALERHPGFKLVLAEAGIGWLPYFSARWTSSGRRSATSSTTRRRPPSELFRRQVMATFEEEALGPS